MCTQVTKNSLAENNVTIKSMHLFDLKVMRKFLLRGRNDKIIHKLIKKSISKILIDLKPHVPKEFAAKPKHFKEI